ncbi:protein TALPID3 [Stigmatopora argus]
MSVLWSRSDINRRPLAAKIGPEAGSVRLSIQRVAGESQGCNSRPPKSAGHKPNRGVPRRSSFRSEAGHDLQTCRFEAGSRGAVLAALRQRAHSAPQWREEKCRPSEPQRGISRDPTLFTGAHRAVVLESFHPSIADTLAPPQAPPHVPPTARPEDPAADSPSVSERSARTDGGSDPVATATRPDPPREELRPSVVSVATQANHTLVATAKTSALDEARRRLRHIQRQKKVLEENMATLERARAGEVLRCQLEALAANSQSSEQARIKKTVDAWIHLMGRDVQARVEAESSHRRPVPAPSSRSSAYASRPTSSLKATGRGLRGRPAARLAPPAALAAPLPADGEAYLTRLYGRAPRDVKRSLPLRSTPFERKPRPLMANDARGPKWKAPPPPSSRSAPAPRRPPHPTSGVAPPPPPAVAIPLAHPRIGPSPRCLQTTTQRPVVPPPEERTAQEPSAPDASTKDLRAPSPRGLDPLTPEPEPDPDPPAPETSSRSSPVPVQAEEEEELDVGLDLKRHSSTSEKEAGAGEDDEAPPPPAITVQAMESDTEKDPEEANVFPGSHFLSVADVGQDSLASAEGEEGVRLDGGPSPPPADYQGPDFPPGKRGLPPSLPQSCVPNLDDDLLNRMVQWVEQQLMTRLIREQYRPPVPEPKAPSESSRSSDAGEAAGGGDVPRSLLGAGDRVDPTLVQNLVHQVLAEMMDEVLEAEEFSVPTPIPQPAPSPGVAGPSPEELPEEVPAMPTVTTPLPTPLPSPVPSTRDPSPLPTPPPSEPSQSPVDDLPVAPQPEAVATPLPSPEQNPDGVPNEVPDETSSPSLLQLDGREESGGAADVPEEVLPSPPPPPKSPPMADPDPASSSSSSSSEDSASTTASTSGGDSGTVTGSDTGLRMVSEGELLISFNHADATATELGSSASSFQENPDPPSEGEVVGAPVAGTAPAENRMAPWQDELSLGEVSPSAVSRFDQSKEAVLDATDESMDLDPTLTPGLLGRPSRAPREGGVLAPPSEPAEATPTSPDKMMSSSDSSTDFF